MHHIHYHQGSLQVESVSLEELAREHGTPLFVYSAGTIRAHYQRLTEALEPVPHRICYAMKANSNLSVLRLLAELGGGFDIVSAGELYRVLQAGGKASSCTFAGVAKTVAEMEYALNEGILCFNVESEAELARLDRVAQRLGKKAPFAIRVNPDVDAATHKYISTGKSENKFGIAFEQIAGLYQEAAKRPGLRAVGVQMHIGSQITKLDPFLEAIKRMRPLVLELHQLYGIEHFSIGGGLGIAYHDSLDAGVDAWWKDEESRIALPEYAAAVRHAVDGLPVEVILEPGRVLVGNAGVLVTRVEYVKQGPSKKFVIVDTGMHHLIRPALYEGYHEIVPLKEGSGAVERVDVVGPICESGDFLAQNRDMPVVQEGDFLAVLSAGAYGFSMASNYNSHPMPAEVLVQGDQARVVRKRQSLEDLIAAEL
ncbi:MAG: diaminopimelate decarboxylase [Verrucomicrobiales bacterium]